ncbi:MAG: OmpA family protein [Bdellovibrionaceae bacterium]|nr:OmpA family protein [Pseudobdellovibrionaceae bacterium]
MFRQLALFSAVIVLAFGCSSKKKVDEQGPDKGVVETTPLNFDVAGSDSGKIPGLYTINFDFDKSTLSEDAKSKLRMNADWMRKNPDVKMTIEGHCDSRGSIEYNVALGERRAKVTRDYLVSLGIPRSRMKIVSFGEEKLLDQADTEAAHAANRRANFVPAK